MDFRSSGLMQDRTGIKSFGRVEVPDFPVIGWTGAAKSVVDGTAPPTASEWASDFMNDEIPDEISF
jgi:hypothetical protein